MLNPIRISKTQNAQAPSSLNAPRSVSPALCVLCQPSLERRWHKLLLFRSESTITFFAIAETRFTRVALQMTPRRWNWRDTLAISHSSFMPFLYHPYRASTKLARPSAFRDEREVSASIVETSRYLRKRVFFHTHCSQYQHPRIRKVLESYPAKDK